MVLSNRSKDDCTRIIAVMGATGAQGGSVVRAFHALGDSNKYEVRAITRKPDSEKAKAIVPLVKEVVKADGDDEDSMLRAFEGCYGAFIVTSFWEDFNAQHEMLTLRTIKSAAKKAKLQHVILSSTENTRSYINKAENKDTWEVLVEDGKMYVPHFDGKGEVVEEYATELPTTKVFFPFYMENFITRGMGPSRQSDIEPYAITLPMGNAKLSMVAVEDMGKCVCAVFEDGDTYIGKEVGSQGDALTCADIADTFGKICGQPVVYNAVSPDVYASFGFPGAKEISVMCRFWEEFESKAVPHRTPSDELVEKMGGGLISLEDFIKANKASFVLEPMVTTSRAAEEKSPTPASAAPQPKAGASGCCVLS